jgi:type VI secretion system secreted protein VgrG
MRARDGMLISTEERQNAQAHMLDMGETTRRLTDAEGQHHTLAEAAQSAGAQDRSADQSEVVESLKTQNNEIRGGATGQDGFPELQAPHVVIASAAGIETTSAGSTHMAANEHIALTSARHASIVSGGSFFASVRNAIRLFAYKTGIRLVSAREDIDVQALTQNIKALAKLDINATANRITLTAEKEILINGGGSYTSWKAESIESGSTDSIISHTGAYAKVGPDNKLSPLPPPPFTLKDLQGKLAYTLRSHPVGGYVFANEPYTIYRGSAKIEDGVTDANGQIIIKDHQEGTTSYTVELSTGHRFELSVKTKFDNLDDELAARGFHATGGDSQDRLRHHQYRQGS